MRLRAAIVGLGRIGLGYDLTSRPADVFSHAKAYREHPAFELVAGCDPDPGRRGEFSAFCGAAAYADPREMLAATRPEVVSVCAPTSRHRAMVELALEFGPRLILCEKPLADDFADGLAMVARCRNRGVALAVNYMRRCDPGVVQLRRRLREGALGEIYKGVLIYSKGLLHNGSHYLDLLVDWLGMPEAFRVLHPGPTQTPAGPEPDVWIEFPDGAGVTVLAGREARYSVMELDLMGSHGRLRYADLGDTIELWHVAEDPMFPGYRILERTADVPQPQMGRYQYHVMDALARHLNEGAALASSGETALAALRVCTRIASGLDRDDLQPFR